MNRAERRRQEKAKRKSEKVLQYCGKEMEAGNNGN